MCHQMFFSTSYVRNLKKKNVCLDHHSLQHFLPVFYTCHLCIYPHPRPKSSTLLNLSPTAIQPSRRCMAYSPTTMGSLGVTLAITQGFHMEPKKCRFQNRYLFKRTPFSASWFFTTSKCQRDKCSFPIFFDLKIHPPAKLLNPTETKQFLVPVLRWLRSALIQNGPWRCSTHGPQMFHERVDFIPGRLTVIL